MGRLGNGEISQSKRAIKWRANKQLQNAAIALEKLGSELVIEGETIVPRQKPVDPAPQPTNDAIGVFSADPAPVAKAAPLAQTYHCGNCEAGVSLGDERCQVCERQLQWAGIG